ncbi:hypothetical protein HUJ04_000146 [Dendroctonus ponderosae]|nr:hypothetical protein HUJ04_000146 [Dendroctonus ponderosae]
MPRGDLDANRSPSKSRGVAFGSEPANHSLLHEESPPPAGLHNEFFGNFKGFSLTPMKEAEPAAPAPALSISSLLSRPVQKINSFRRGGGSSAGAAPVLPPMNQPRPVISSPVLESSTSSAKELISPLRNAPKVPVRPAPGAPDVAPKTAINRIASFLKPAERAAPDKAAPKKPLDRTALRTLQISDPVPQTHIDIAVTALPVDAAKRANTAAVEPRGAVDAPGGQPQVGALRGASPQLLVAVCQLSERPNPHVSGLSVPGDHEKRPAGVDRSAHDAPVGLAAALEPWRVVLCSVVSNPR